MDIIIHGSSGKMGQALTNAAAANNVRIICGLDIGDDLARVSEADIVIDFSAPAATCALLEAVVKNKIPLVIGTTGFDAGQLESIAAAAKGIPILKSGNMSLGVAVLARLAEQAAALLNEDWDIEIFEMHHRDKLDAPSGTALLLGEAAARGRRVKLNPPQDNRNGARTRGEIGYAVARGGGVIGEHQVSFAGDKEVLTIGHSAQSREIFAQGAMRAAHWLASQKAGLYSLQNMLDKNK